MTSEAFGSEVRTQKSLDRFHIKMKEVERDELEHLLDDDEDMAEMYLTDKLEQQLDNSSSSSSFVNEVDEEILQTEIDDRVPAEGLMDGNGHLHERDLQQMDNHSFRANTLGRDSRGTRTSTTRSGNSKHLDVEELEMLFEAYFVQIDGTLNKLSTVSTYEYLKKFDFTNFYGRSVVVPLVPSSSMLSLLSGARTKGFWSE